MESVLIHRVAYHLSVTDPGVPSLLEYPLKMCRCCGGGGYDIVVIVVKIEKKKEEKME